MSYYYASLAVRFPSGSGVSNLIGPFDSKKHWQQWLEDFQKAVFCRNDLEVSLALIKRKQKLESLFVLSAHICPSQVIQIFCKYHEEYLPRSNRLRLGIPDPESYED